MVEKRKRRAKPPALVQERANLDFPKSSSQQASSDNNDNERKLPPLQQMTTNESDTTKSQARRLLDSQRDSVAFLSKMRECLEQLFRDNNNGNHHCLTESLQRDGFGYVDSFLNHDPFYLNALYKEAIAVLMMESSSSSSFQMQPDINQLGSGEYTVSIQGGSEQYQICPRSIEWVVTTTKYWGIGMADWEHLDHTNCMATMRTFDRKSQLSSWELLVGESSAKFNDQDTTGRRPDPLKRWLWIRMSINEESACDTTLWMTSGMKCVEEV